MTFVRSLLFLLFLACVPASAQDTQIPEIRTSLEKDTAVPGQPLIYRVTVLVPTWLPSPPAFPSYETPNVVVRLPSRASGPTSETINGETWSGVTRSYRLYPMTAGTFQIPAGTIKVTYADPDDQQPVVVDVQTDAFEITGKIPAGAEDLDPFLAAKSLTLERSVEGATDDLKVGDALNVKTIAKVSGVALMFVPPLAEVSPADGLASYPKEPVLDEKEDRGLLSGTRTEETALVAEAAGTYTLPEKSLSWYNLESGAVETAEVPEISFEVTGTAAEAPVEPVARVDLRGLAMAVVLLALAAGLVYWAWHTFLPKVRRKADDLKARYHASESYLFGKLVAAIKHRDFSGTLHCASAWNHTVEGGIRTADRANFEVALHACGALTYAKEATLTDKDADICWTRLLQSARTMRRNRLKNGLTASHFALPDINPR
ncbi:BatD family protein [Roseibium sp.]|uniref:BatD family protein n=1 Tax=Roseibium sp. TaxID=1936156 RepID=UPI003B51282B